jgi:hypothetical protein
MPLASRLNRSGSETFQLLYNLLLTNNIWKFRDEMIHAQKFCL